MKEAYLSIGGNLLDRREILRSALVLIHGQAGVTLTKVSSFYETAPWGKTNQPNFLNACVKILTTLPPEELLKKLQNIENILGRERKERWGERTVDIDIVHYEGANIKGDFLTLPHPYFSERNFVLIPLFEIAPNLLINDIPIKTYLEKCEDKLPVKKVEGSPKDFNLTIIAAMDKNRGIGAKDKLLCRIESDLKYFRENTLNHVIILGKNTFLEIPKLDKREIVVLSKKESFGDICTANSAMELFKILDNFKNKKIFVAGGEKIYNLLTPYANFAVITRILSEKSADKFLPILYDFSLKEMRFSEEHGVKFAFCAYEKE